MKKVLSLSLLFSLLLFATQLKAVPGYVETFDDEADGSTTFTDQGVTFNIVSLAGGSYQVVNWDGVGYDGNYSDWLIGYNSGYSGNPSLKFTSATAFTAKGFWLLLSDIGGTISSTGNVTLEGKLGGVSQFIAIDNFTAVPNGATNSFQYLDLHTFGGIDNASKAIDEIIISAGGNHNILYLDGFTWFDVPVPSIDTHPVNKTVCANGSTTFEVAATNVTSYQWQVDNGGGFANLSNSTPYADVTTNTLTITGATITMNGYLYRCVANDSTNSNSATLTVNAVPTLIASADTTLCAASSPVTLTASGPLPGQEAVNFDGVDDYLVIADHADLRPAAGITLAAWINPVDQTTYGFIFGKEIPGADYLLSVDPDNHIHGRFYTNNGNWPAYTTLDTVPVGMWTHVAVTYDNATIEVYINGVLSESFPVNEPLTLNGATTPLSIGRRNDNALFFKGKIDDASVWDRALTAAELDELMNFNIDGAGAGLMGYWQMNEGAGTTVADGSGGSHTATLTNGPAWVTSEAAAYRWSPATGLSATVGSSIIAITASSQTYTVSFTTSEGCTATEQVAVNIASSCPPIWNGTNTWSSNPNWTNGSPDVSDSVIVQSGTLTVDANATVDDLTLENGTSLIVQPGKTLIVKGDLINNGGTFTVQNGGSIVFEGEMKKAMVTRLKTFGKVKVMSGTLHLRN